ncbi:hypothetical protein CXF46_04490 [Corynebacterium bovis]|nr:hypothetical protein CXF29_09780 [Corynebacterium bovis]RRQ15923.1 hypothetical protein CXF46_04490 [Corynebacterium bovis]
MMSSATVTERPSTGTVTATDPRSFMETSSSSPGRANRIVESRGEDIATDPVPRISLGVTSFPLAVTSLLPGSPGTAQTPTRASLSLGELLICCVFAPGRACPLQYPACVLTRAAVRGAPPSPAGAPRVCVTPQPRSARSSRSACSVGSQLYPRTTVIRTVARACSRTVSAPTGLGSVRGVTVGAPPPTETRTSCEVDWGRVRSAARLATSEPSSAASSPRIRPAPGTVIASTTRSVRCAGPVAGEAPVVVGEAPEPPPARSGPSAAAPVVPFGPSGAGPPAEHAATARTDAVVMHARICRRTAGCVVMMCLISLVGGWVSGWVSVVGVSTAAASPAAGGSAW